MAVITGCYESHVSGALLPNVNDCRHRNFHDYHKKPIPREEKRYECVHMCKTAQIPACVGHILYCRAFVIGATYSYITDILLYDYCIGCLSLCVCVAMCVF